MKPIGYIDSGLIHGRLGDSHYIMYTNSMFILPIHGIMVECYIIKETIQDNIKDNIKDNIQ